MIRKGPCFTEAARAAAAAKRRERAGLAALTFAMPSVFVVRASESSQGFRWEIRRFGGVTLATGRAVFATSAEARTAGLLALADTAGAARLDDASPDPDQRLKASAIERPPKAMNISPDARRNPVS